MALTDRSDIFAALREDGLNRFLVHARRQRPSLFNYATQAIADHPDRLCQAITAHPIVAIRNNPLVTITDPLPIPGTNFGLDFAVQVVDCQVDFHPGGLVPLPPQLAPPLGAQRLALSARVCGGIACPPAAVVDPLIPPPPEPGGPPPPPPPPDIQVLPGGELICFCVDLFAVGGVRIREYFGKPWLEPFLDGFEIVDIEPEALENALECYVQLVIRLAVLPQLRILLETAPLKIIDDVHLVLSPEPTSAALPNNPAIEDDQLKAFIHVEVV